MNTFNLVSKVPGALHETPTHFVIQTLVTTPIQFIEYFIVCSRQEPGGPVSTEMTTWGEIKARYQD